MSVQVTEKHREKARETERVVEFIVSDGEDVSERVVEALALAFAEFEEKVREECAALCLRRAQEQRWAAQDLVEHYGNDANDEASMYDADAIGAEALANAIVGRPPKSGKRA